MAVLMLAFMCNILHRRRVDVCIAAGGLLAFATALSLARSRRTVEDVSRMRAMIPHYSTAILTSEREQIKDP